MAFIVIPFIFLMASYPFLADQTALYCLFFAQISILVGVIKQKHLTGSSAFLFMSVLFFGMRPLYLWLEDDFILFTGLFEFIPSKEMLNTSMWWATLAMLFFQLGGFLTQKIHSAKWQARSKIARKETRSFPLVNARMIYLLFFYQIVTLGVMMVLSKAGTTLYGSALGAYIYDLPAVMQAGHIFSLLLTLERYMKLKNQKGMFACAVATLLFLLFTLEMRNISNFRGFYLTGLMAGGIAVLARLRGSVNALWLIIPVALLLPAFRMLGEMRYQKTDELTELLGERDTNAPLSQQYWDFYNGTGDMNIFDTFVAANESKPAHKPYLLSWLYVPVHLVPRGIWESKPKQGILQDVEFMNGAPYSPGIAGFFLLDGGKWWMLLCMLVLGYLISYLDWTVLTMPRTYLRFCLYGVLVVTALGLSRYFLWQYFYQTLYAVLPCLIFAKIVNRNAENNRGNNRSSSNHANGLVSKRTWRKPRTLAPRSSSVSSTPNI